VVRANGEATRARVLEVAAESFARCGYEGSSLRQIANSADIDLSTLKYHFGDKPALFAEVYRIGQQAFIHAIAPLVAALGRVQTAAELRAQLRTLVDDVYDYMSDNTPFLRITLFRLLEQPAQVIEQEARLQGDAIAFVELALEHLRKRGIVRPVDLRGAVVLLITALPTWFLASQHKPQWLGDSELADRERFSIFFVDLLENHLVADLV
jgi:AcrR family transcriptional regulator